MKHILILISLIFIFEILPMAISTEKNNELFIVWNIGQGQWTTHIKNETCVHYDFGQERPISEKLFQLCQNKLNILKLSHWDTDHRSGIKSLKQQAANLCHSPWPSLQFIKKRPPMFINISECSKQTADDTLVFSPMQKSFKNANETSQVFLVKGEILIPGDSPISQEKKWVQHSAIKSTRILILGHHGSKTSTSMALLEKLPRLQMAISSSRYAKYKHPHKEVIERLKKTKTPILKTEDWGHIIIQL